ncbi:uncharacterized protein KY384_000442 [Bacidia gigantensis]|uniref:uncharacterized protein n=1 Tax=Bacidia gigantensis TaxID=2732470 RepID=UPI001D049806|nr:uncharacterized protein KY384_000442 [Bacidia gigantensis]KAG8525682.1 hypothetical protein KY384_000442 [Bacidia gigantensis]
MPLRDSLPSIPSWSQTKTVSKAGFDKVYHVVDKLGPPVNRLSNKLGSEAFWPTTLDRESDKAARILRSFCKDGFYVEEDKEAGYVGAKKDDGVPKGKQRVIKKIPTEVIKRAKGLAIFTTMRTGLWVSGAGGSGILVARTADGSWSPPSGILLHTAGLGFLVGVDIYDCVVVINTEKALEAFTKIRCTLGGEVSAVAGPVGIGGVLETELHKRQAPVWNYLKSRGFYAGVQIDGTVIIERGDENERFYGERIAVVDILAGKVRHPPREIGGLIQTIKAAQGDVDVDESALPDSEPTPGDYEVKGDDNGFGLPPSEDDPDPFGVKALEEQGMEVREAGTRSRPSGDVFEYRPSPTSPIYATFHSRKNSKRDSERMSIASVHTDRGTQTDDLASPEMANSPEPADEGSPARKATENLAEDIDDGSSGSGEEHHKTEEATVISRAKLVQIPKRVPPALPPRSPYRSSNPIPSPTAIPDAASPTQQTGLGIDMHGSQDAEQGLYPIPSHSSIEERLQQVHLAPSRNSERLSPNKDGFDDVDMSGSDYSRSRGNTPGVMSGGATPAEETVEDTIVMKDAEAEDAKDVAKTGDAQHDTPAEENTPHLSKQNDNGETDFQSAQYAPPAKDKDESEDFSMPGEFHSVPSTPLGPGPEPSFPTSAPGPTSAPVPGVLKEIPGIDPTKVEGKVA